MSSKGTVFVAMSGGVDSSVSAALLKNAGYSVTGVFIRVWNPEWLECDWKTERHDAMRVCAKLDIPFTTIDLSKEYKKNVVDYMIEEYRSGRTPNPDVMCNKHIKFGAFFDYIESEKIQYLATGHYARVYNIQDRYHLFTGIDSEKDQTYFLWTLSENILSRTLFPIGEMRKGEVRMMARAYDLPVAEKKDSQGICFLGKVNMREFLKHYIKSEKGDVLNTQGNVIGAHEGALLYTIGQRHGFKIDTMVTNSLPHYVVNKDISRNTITVSKKNCKYEKDYQTKNQKITLRDSHWITGIPTSDKIYNGRIRYRQQLQKCTIRKKYETTIIEFNNAQHNVTLGQSIVVYDKDICMGGGIIQSVF